MQRISPLRSSIEALNNKFKSLNNNKPQATNPFAVAFKGTCVQMDVFENSSAPKKTASAADFFKNSWNNALGKFSNLKSSTIAFGSKLKENAISAGKKIQNFANQKVEFDLFKYNVARLQHQPVSELKDMLACELQGK